MRLLVDVNVPREVVRRLRELGHHVTYAAEDDAQQDDDQWLAVAEREGRTLITEDKDFGELVFRRLLLSGTVILLRLKQIPLADRPSWLQPRWKAILSAPVGSFVVVTHNRLRVRRRTA